MHRLRKIVQNKELLDILNEKATETNLPFEAFRNLCDKFGYTLSDDQCGFICANFLRKIDNGAIFIDFAAFLGGLKSDKDKSVLRDMTSNIEDRSISESERRSISNSPLRKFLRPRQSMSEE